MVEDDIKEDVTINEMVDSQEDDILSDDNDYLWILDMLLFVFKGMENREKLEEKEDDINVQ